jgi:hypothetical protein
MNDAEKPADGTGKLPIEPSRRKAAPTESKEYADAVSEGWPVSPHPRHPRNPKAGEVQ